MSAVAAIILAAGASVRLGSPKQMARLGGETLLERAVRISTAAGLSPVYGVVQADLLLDPLPSGMIRVVNAEAAEGMASSIRAGVRALDEAIETISGTLILACDQPAVTPEHLRELARGESEVVASGYAGRKGIPAYFPARIFRELLNLRGDAGARELLKLATAIDLPGGELDIDTVEDLAMARKLYSSYGSR